MKIMDPRTQSTDEIVESLLTNTKHQYTESAHAEIYSRLIKTISDFNAKAARGERFMMILATAQVILGDRPDYFGSEEIVRCGFQPKVKA